MGEGDDVDERQPLLNERKDSYGAGDDVTVAIKSGKKDGDEAEAEEKDNKSPPVSFGKLFRYATCWDRILMIWGSIVAAAVGAGWPVLSIVFGDMTDTFIGGPNSTLANSTGNSSKAGYDEMMTEYMLRYFYIGITVYAASFFQITCWMISSERQTNKMRKAFFWAIMRQEIGWFDQHKSGELSTRLADDLERVREGLGDKFAIFIQFMAAFLSGFAIGFWKGWKLTLVMMSLSPLLAICGAFMAKLISSFAEKEQAAYAEAGSVAEEMLACIRTVVSFCGQKKAIDNYEKALIESRRLGVRKAAITGGGIGITMLILYSTYALAFWYGSTQVQTWQETLGIDGISPGEVFTVFFCVMIGSFSIGNAAPQLSAIATAKGAAAALYDVIDNEPSIDASSEEGLKLNTVKGDIELKECEFSYQTRPDVKVLKHFSMKVEPGKTIALVGSSGCGKSTVINLLQRFYDVSSGQITIDGHDIRSLNMKWLRQQIGVVSQEPVLFGCSIQENILYGRDGVTEAEIIEAASMANAHNFISNLPKGYETLVGERGAQLSGGQKQRVAIARALVRDPKILLLDEATAALDVESEKMVQDALDKAREGRTTIIVAHRLSTIQNADIIYAVQDGEVAEIGTHSELMAKEGIYQQLVTLQMFGDKAKEEKKESGDVVDAKTPEGFKVKRLVSRSKSVTSLQEEDEEGELKDLDMPSFGKIFKQNRPELCYILIGCLGSLVNGSAMPVFAVLFSNIIQVFTETGEKLKNDAIFWSLMFLALGGITGIAQLTTQLFLGLSGETLTMRLRLKTFTSMLGQEIGWFDEPRHATGALTTRLATDASVIKFATGARVGIVLQSVFGMAAGLGIAFYFGWKLALAVLAMVPILVIAGALQMQALTKRQKRDSKLLEDAGNVATESIENIRTVQSLTLEQKRYERYEELLVQPNKEAIKQAFIYGLSYGLSQGVIFIMYGGAFKFGSYLVETGDMQPDAVYRVFFAIAFTGLGVGQASSFLPDYAKAKLAAAHIFRIVENVPFINSYSEEGKQLGDLKGDIEFAKVSFKYPSRPNVRVLKEVSFNIPAGNTIALVGASGCGKSTMVALLQRFYDPEQGTIKLDNVDIKELNIEWMRSNISVVSQEPVLFDISIRENIRYGVLTEVDDQKIFDAARLANIHDFIVSLPEGYDTIVGEKGTQLSGGQKQRVAIARAMVGNPRILLLDEATSALDTESERVVQEALDKAREGRTCLIIAHRLSTVQTADTIAVVDNGQIVEMGSPNALLDQKGAYYTLASGQLNLV